MSRDDWIVSNGAHVNAPLMTFTSGGTGEGLVEKCWHPTTTYWRINTSAGSVKHVSTWLCDGLPGHDGDHRMPDTALDALQAACDRNGTGILVSRHP